MGELDFLKFKKLINQYGISKENNEYFLGIIGKSYDECIISRLILYALNNCEILNNLIQSETIETIDDSGTELAISDDRRIDIYFKGTLTCNKKYLIIIENKINSNVHSQQCKAYYQWARCNYKNHVIFCFLLKPSYNPAEPDDKEHYKIITYDELYHLIGKSENIYISELRKEIKNCLMEKEYSELDIFILNNLQKLWQKTTNLWKEINAYIKRIVEKFNNNGVYTFDNTYAQDHTYIRLYDDKAKWWSGYKENNRDEQYYFYFEIRISMNLKDIFIQQIAKRYTKNTDSKISRFMKENEFNDIEHSQYYIISHKKFKSSHSDRLFSDEWKEEFEKWFFEEFFESSNKIRDIVEKFRKFN